MSGGGQGVSSLQLNLLVKSDDQEFIGWEGVIANFKTCQYQLDFLNKLWQLALKGRRPT